MNERWLTFLYQYGLGGLVFFASIWLLWRKGMLGEDRATRRRWVLLLVLGLLLYMVGQGLLQFVGPVYDLKAGGGP